MPKVVSRLFGKLSARSEIEILACVILLMLSVAAYQHGKHVAEARAKVGQLDKERRQNADTIAARTAKVADARKASDSAGKQSGVALARARGFPLRPAPVRRLSLTNDSLQAVPANASNQPQVDSLYAVIANRDSAIALHIAAEDSLVRENALLKIERKPTDDLIASLNRQIALDVQEIGTLKSMKLPRFGVKTGIVIGALTAIAVDTGIHAIRK